jgi:hypothetical protein
VVFFFAGPDGHADHVAEVAAILVNSHAVGLFGIGGVDDVVCVLSVSYAANREGNGFRLWERSECSAGRRVVTVVIRVKGCRGR